MMSPISGNVGDAVSDLKALLELAADPKKLAKAVADLEESAKSAKLAIAEKSRIEADVDNKLKKLAADAPVVEAKLAKLKEVETDLEKRQGIFNTGLSDLEYREQTLARERDALQFAIVKHLADVEAHKRSIKENHAALAQKQAAADAAKAEYEAKLVKLKQAMA